MRIAVTGIGLVFLLLWSTTGFHLDDRDKWAEEWEYYKYAYSKAWKDFYRR